MFPENGSQSDVEMTSISTSGNRGRKEHRKVKQGVGSIESN